MNAMQTIPMPTFKIERLIVETPVLRQVVDARSFRVRSYDVTRPMPVTR